MLGGLIKGSFLMVASSGKNPTISMQSFQFYADKKPTSEEEEEGRGALSYPPVSFPHPQ